jgi:hypothetical protein
MAPRDDSWLMGALAAQDAYRGPWPEEYGPPAPPDPWAPSMAAMKPVGRALADAPGKLASSADYYVGMPSRAMAGPDIGNYPPGSEEAEFLRQRHAKGLQDWAQSTALSTVFDPFALWGVKPGVPGVSLGSGAGGGGKIVQPQPKMGELADVTLTGEILGPQTGRPALAGVSAQQQAKLGPMVSQLEKLGATPKQINAFTPQQAYDFIKARNYGAQP